MMVRHEKSADTGIIISGPIVIKCCFRVIAAAGKLIGIVIGGRCRDGAIGGEPIAVRAGGGVYQATDKRIVGIALNNRSATVT